MKRIYAKNLTQRQTHERQKKERSAQNVLTNEAKRKAEELAQRLAAKRTEAKKDVQRLST